MLVETFPCFGATVTIRAAGDPRIVAPAVAHARRIAEDLHVRLTRFDRGSELSRLDADPREVVPASPVLHSPPPRASGTRRRRHPRVHHLSGNS